MYPKSSLLQPICHRWLVHSQKILYSVGGLTCRLDRLGRLSSLVSDGFCCILGVFSSSFFTSLSWLCAECLIGITLKYRKSFWWQSVNHYLLWPLYPFSPPQLISFYSFDDSSHFCVMFGFLFDFFECRCIWYSINGYKVHTNFNQIWFLGCCGTGMSAHKISRIFWISSRSIDQLTVIGHQTKFPPFNSQRSLLVVLDDANKGLMISDDRKLGNINIEMEIFHSPNYSKHFSLCLGVAAFNITQCTTCIAKNFTLLYQDHQDQMDWHRRWFQSSFLDQSKT